MRRLMRNRLICPMEAGRGRDLLVSYYYMRARCTRQTLLSCMQCCNGTNMDLAKYNRTSDNADDVTTVP